MEKVVLAVQASSKVAPLHVLKLSFANRLGVESKWTEVGVRIEMIALFSGF